MKVLSAI